VPVFCYHVIQGETFEHDLMHLRDGGYVTIDADQLLDHLCQRKAAPSRSVVLSFDDGARNLYEVAFPLLRRFGMKAVAFVAPRFHDEAQSMATREDRPCTWAEIEEMHASGLIDFQS